jgi:hypothetical protein
MTKVNKGDRVRLIHLDGTISEKSFTVYDVWGSESSPRNASFISGGQEHYCHSDLMKHVDDDTPVVVPDGGEWFIARGDNFGWGRAQTEKQAIANMRRQGGGVKAYTVHRVSKWTMVDGMGSLTYPIGIEPVEVKTIKPKK